MIFSVIFVVEICGYGFHFHNVLPSRILQWTGLLSPHAEKHDTSPKNFRIPTLKSYFSRFQISSSPPSLIEVVIFKMKFLLFVKPQ